jgi:uncharacterized protein (TIGR02271 family)
MSGTHRGDDSYADETRVNEPVTDESYADASYAERTDVTTSTDSGVETIAHEERLEVGTQVQEIGEVHVRKQVESHPVEYTVPRDVEHVDTNERIVAKEGDSGEVELLDDGSVSIPVFEEVLVVTKRLVVRERVIVRKRTVVDEYKLQTELRRENVTVDVDDSVDVQDNTSQSSGMDDGTSSSYDGHGEDHTTSTRQP